MDKKIVVFNPSVVEATKIAEKYKGLTIKGLGDKEGYKAVYDGQQELKKLRVDITKFGKKEREEALAYQKEVIRQEKELLAVIVPVEDALKFERDKIDEEKKKEERRVLLPSRVKMLEEIGLKVDDDILLSMDEKEFSETYNERKMTFLEEQERKRKEEEDAKRRAEELEKAKTEAAEKAKKEAEAKAEREKKEEAERVEKEKKEAERKKEEELKKKEEEKIEAIKKAEREKQEEINRIKREQEEKERVAKEEKDRLELEAKEKERLKKEEQIKTEKNKKYQDWLKENGIDETSIKSGNYRVEKIDGKTLALWKIIDTLTL